ncbi:efflux RND transporter periplasmic adaptor subunit [Massilibacteroides sp.]|uniref:efflux RND transporter periplasmic adaptor subunit n=1 Tax=Massilibacteroides sp. TaxID=2034766 RepID=UPI002638DEF9|nr:efflux RND transporter periplasmic adaptor subunit [Massilibacteroides sp.]MDD4516413.1 efflux RND transporter periplasmic adaptor subunit [Massilibacteroides sp.]
MKTNQRLFLLPALAFVLLASCSGEKKAAVVEEEKPKVKIETVKIEAVDQVQEFTATVEANISNNIAPQAAGRIQKLQVEIGDHVKAGQVLAIMDETTLRQTKIQLDNQELEFKRIDELYKVGGASKSSWDALKMQLEVTRTVYKNLEENSKLISPITGIVTARNYDNGDMYSSGTPIYRVEQIRPVKLMVNVSETYFTSIKKGQEVAVTMDVYPGEEFTGNVSLVYPTIDATTRTFPVELKVNNADERVRPGMFARVTLSFGVLDHVVVPDLAIVKQAGSGDRFVYAYKNGKVSYEKVVIGRRMGDRYEIVSGLSDGDQVVVSGQTRLVNGVDVEVVK